MELHPRRLTCRSSSALTIVLFGGAAFMMGQALARDWRPAYQAVAYGLVLTVAERLADNFLFAARYHRRSAFPTSGP